MPRRRCRPNNQCGLRSTRRLIEDECTKCMTDKLNQHVEEECTKYCNNTVAVHQRLKSENDELRATARTAHGLLGEINGSLPGGKELAERSTVRGGLRTPLRTPKKRTHDNRHHSCPDWAILSGTLLPGSLHHVPDGYEVDGCSTPDSMRTSRVQGVGIQRAGTCRN